MQKAVYREREVTFEVEIGENIKVTAKGYSRQAVTVSIPGETSQKYTMDDKLIQILDCPKKDLARGGDITISVSTYDVLVIRKTLFGVKVLRLNSM